MRKKIFNVVFFIILLVIYFGKDYLYSFFSDEYVFPESVVSVYESKNACDIYFLGEDIFVYEPTKILYRDLYDFSEYITIYKGEDYEFSKDMAVVDNDALVGIVTDVYDSSSTVMLLTNADTVLSIKVGSSYGILKYVSNDLVITNLTSEDFDVGDEIFTSGYSKLNEGILIGFVSSKKENSLEVIYYVSLLAEFNDIKYLTVIKDVK